MNSGLQALMAAPVMAAFAVNPVQGGCKPPAAVFTGYRTSHGGSIQLRDTGHPTAAAFNCGILDIPRES